MHSARIFVSSTLLTLAIATNAFAEGAPDCPTASERGQRLQGEGKYVEAREMYLSCARESCPSVVRKDCTKWLTELDDSLPSVVFSATSPEGADLGDVRVTIDGVVTTTRLDGKPIAINPGEHVLRFEAEGDVPIEEKIIVRVGELHRLVGVTFKSNAPAIVPTVVAPRATASSAPRAAPSASPRATSPLVFVLGGAAAVAFASSAYFGVRGKNDLATLRSTCAPYCEQSQLDAVKTKMAIADTSLGVGVVAIGVAAVLFFSHGSQTSDSATHAAIPSFDLRATTGGGFATLRGEF